MSDVSSDGVRVGLCGWTVAQPAYVQRYRVVEVQHTFYEPPADALLARWRRQVPAGFEFTLKAWQLVTHTSSSPTYRRIKMPLAAEDRGEVGAFRSTPPVLRAWARTLSARRSCGPPPCCCSARRASGRRARTSPG